MITTWLAAITSTLEAMNRPPYHPVGAILGYFSTLVKEYKHYYIELLTRGQMKIKMNILRW